MSHREGANRYPMQHLNNTLKPSFSLSSNCVFCNFYNSYRRSLHFFPVFLSSTGLKPDAWLPLLSDYNFPKFPAKENYTYTRFHAHISPGFNQYSLGQAFDCCIRPRKIPLGSSAPTGLNPKSSLLDLPSFPSLSPRCYFPVMFLPFCLSCPLVSFPLCDPFSLLCYVHAFNQGFFRHWDLFLCLRSHLAGIQSSVGFQFYVLPPVFCQALVSQFEKLC